MSSHAFEQASPAPRRAAGASARRIAARLVAAVLAFAGLLGLTGCDDKAWIISRVDRSVAFDEAMIRAMAADGGVPTEIYGAPWPGAAPEDVASHLRMPASLPKDIRFRAIAPRSLPPRHPHKLVLVFNGAASPDPLVACDLDASEPVDPPAATGFELFAVFCRGRTANSGWMAHGHLAAPKHEAGDWAGFESLSRVFFKAILSDYSGRSDK